VALLHRCTAHADLGVVQRVLSGIGCLRACRVAVSGAGAPWGGVERTNRKARIGFLDKRDDG
jgi:hypothetical protein